MKPETFAEMLLGYSAALVKGFTSAAQNEIYEQVIVDEALKTRWGVPLEHTDFGGKKIREIPYPTFHQKGKSVDFGATLQKINKETTYFIEIKAESGHGKGKFSGKSWYAALQADIEKLKPVVKKIYYVTKMRDAVGFMPAKGRCFAALISFHPDTTAAIKGAYAQRFPGSVMRSSVHGHYEVCILVKEVTVNEAI